MPSSQRLSHVAMSVPAGTLTDEWRSRVLAFYGEVFGWHEIKSLRLPDRLTIAVGGEYINVRERADAPKYSGYEHFGVAVEELMAPPINEDSTRSEAKERYRTKNPECKNSAGLNYTN